MMKKCLCMVIALLLLLPLLGLAEEETSLTAVMKGMRYFAGSWQEVPLEGSFTLMVDGQEMGTIATGEKCIVPAGEVQLLPVAEQMPEGWLKPAGGFRMTARSGQDNLATLVVYEDAGLFRVRDAEAGQEYTVNTVSGETVHVFMTSMTGTYVADTSIPSGQYYLMQDQMWRGMLTITPYQGMENQVTEIVPSERMDGNCLIANAKSGTAVVYLKDMGLKDTVVKLPQGWRAADGEGVIHRAGGDYVLVTEAVDEAMIRLDYMNGNVDAEITVLHGPVTAREAAAAGIPGRRIPLQVIGATESGSPAAGRTVTGTTAAGTQVLLNVNGAWYAERAGADGSYCFEYVSDGEGVLVTEGKEYPVPAGDARIDCVTGRGWLDRLMAFLIPSASAEGSGSITVQVFSDSNRNGELGKYEKMIPGVRVSLLANDGSLIASGTSDSNGLVAFAGLNAGSYYVEAQLSDGWAFTPKGKPDLDKASIMNESLETLQRSGAVSLGAGEQKLISIGTMQMGAVEGLIWLDENQNGVMDQGEPGVEGVLVEMIGQKNDLTYQTRSGADGRYNIGQLKPGSYRLRVTVKDGTGFTRYTAKGGQNRSVITAEGKTRSSIVLEIKAGETYGRQNVGLISGASISGTCFVDANYNGRFDEGEALYPGTKLTLSKAYADKPLATAKVDEDGTYAFYGLRSGEYELSALLPDGSHYFSVRANGGNAFYAKAGRKEVTVNNIVLAENQAVKMDLGVYVPGTISGTAYLDSDFSGTLNGREQTVSGIIVNLLDEAGQTVGTARTNPKGKYVLEDVAPGTYTISAAAKRGYAYTRMGGGSVMVNTGNGMGRSNPFTYVMGTKVFGMDLGMILPCRVQGTFFGDANDNGLQDADEGGLKGTVVSLVNSEGVQFTATIGESGAYLFDSVMPGTYWIEFSMPGDGVAARKAEGGNTLNEDLKTASFTMKEGAVYQAPLCGGLLLGRMNGIAFEDVNGSGLKDDNESPLSGAVLTLESRSGSMEPLKAVTGEDGVFSFEGLRPDTYSLTVTCPDGRVVSHTNGLTVEVKSGRNNQMADQPISMGEMFEDQQLGMVYPASVSGSVWLDENNNGLKDDGEAPAGDMLLVVIDESDESVYARIRTAPDGSFTADGLLPGSWTVKYALSETIVAPRQGDTTFRQEGENMAQSGIVLRQGDHNGSLMLGLVKLSSLNGRIWLDDGGEMVPLAKAWVALVVNGETVDMKSTDKDGRWAFEGLMPGAYHVAVQLPEGQLVMEPDDERLVSGRYTSILTTVSGKTGISDEIQVAMTGTYQDLNVISVVPGALGDRVWLDENGNGLQDYDEMGLQGVRIELLRRGVPVAETVSDQYGYYRFANVYPADYVIRATAPEGVTATVMNTDFAGIVSVLKPSEGNTAESGAVTVYSGKKNYNADLGFAPVRNGEYPEGYGEFAAQIWQ